VTYKQQSELRTALWIVGHISECELLKIATGQSRS